MLEMWQRTCVKANTGIQTRGPIPALPTKVSPSFLIPLSLLTHTSFLLILTPIRSLNPSTLLPPPPLPPLPPLRPGSPALPTETQLAAKPTLLLHRPPPKSLNRRNRLSLKWCHLLLFLPLQRLSLTLKSTPLFLIALHRPRLGSNSGPAPVWIGLGSTTSTSLTRFDSAPILRMAYRLTPPHLTHLLVLISLAHLLRRAGSSVTKMEAKNSVSRPWPKLMLSWTSLTTFERIVAPAIHVRTMDSMTHY